MAKDSYALASKVYERSVDYYAQAQSRPRACVRGFGSEMGFDGQRLAGVDLSRAMALGWFSWPDAQVVRPEDV